MTVEDPYLLRKDLEFHRDIPYSLPVYFNKLCRSSGRPDRDYTSAVRDQLPYTAERTVEKAA